MSDPLVLLGRARRAPHRTRGPGRVPAGGLPDDRRERSRNVNAACAKWPWVRRPGSGGLGVEASTAHRLQELIMPVVTVQQGPRSVELKRELVARITDAFVDAYKIPADTVQVWINETPADSWGSAGTLTADK
ncbi:4-oxalocrotonate tautomerase DmpI [Streptomyces lasalocidi]